MEENKVGRFGAYGGQYVPETAFTDYPGNPVVTHKGRDPKVIWYRRAGIGSWRSTTSRTSPAASPSTPRPISRTGNFGSRIDGFYECPELFELPVDGDTNNTKWIVHAADGDYVIGRFDGKTFTAESPKQRWSYGNCFYASQTYNNLPPADGRRIQIAWGRIATPGMPFNQCMLFPCELTLRTTEDGLRMFAAPVREIETLHEHKGPPITNLHIGTPKQFAIRFFFFFGFITHMFAEYDSFTAINDSPRGVLGKNA